MSMVKIEQRIEALECRAASDGRHWLMLYDRFTGNVKGAGGNPAPTPDEVQAEDTVVLVTFPPWDSKLLRMLTADELEERHPGRGERITKLNEAWSGKVVFDAA